MRKEQKIKRVLEYAEKHPASKIDIRGKGSAVNHLKKKGVIGQDKLDYCYERTLHLDLEEQLMVQEQEIEALKVEMGKLVARVVDLERKEKRSFKGLNKILDKLESVEKNQAQIKEQIFELEKAQIKEQKIEDLAGRVARLEKTQKGAKKEQISTSAEEQTGEQIQLSKVLGWSIVQKPATVKGKKYKFFYANKTIEGKQEWIYIGKDPNKAQEKIAKWLAKRQDIQASEG